MTRNSFARGRVDLLSFDWSEAILVVNPGRFSLVEVLDAATGKTLMQSAERNLATRMRLTGLAPDTEHAFDVRWDGGAGRVAFRTLVVPRGELRSSFFAVADPHVSEKAENRKGRLFVESASILRDMVQEANDMGVDGVLVAGDVTNAGTAREFGRAAEILGALRCPLFAAPGDHDIRGGDASLWRAHFGETSRAGEMAGLAVAVLDTSSGALGEGARLVDEAAASDARGAVLVTHAQLIDDGYIRYGKQKGIRDAEACRESLQALAKRASLVYAGHQNVPSRASKGRMVQLNLPQTCQFPCGWVLVREYENGFYHTYRPIRSAALDEASRAASNAAAVFDEPQWLDTYRLGRGPGEANFLVDPARKEA